ncbi:flagellar biosynthesis repressor FlbT [Aliihoeflea aestuarii]|jgi:flagellar biosynthesis repressor protein FlbT|uniref:flagellar biosynthesis repressor FlbT n=1 Tax=Aliihoeflea aestuarii TaxID=453840 RepID=UPI0020950D0D|nr:flagellar biosynthesis repressor FlbT [Aliihoeflea aestuarii]MCO6392903.1 flagellar biosynthesis repressor FlbT [Aliihoeflea aestuarii]
MKNTFKITLKPGEKIYVNGAVIRTDRKVSLEFLNDVQFLLENHVMQPEAATTPLRQLYFIVQIILMSPQEAGDARAMFRSSLPRLIESFESDAIRADLKQIDRMVAEGQVYEAMRLLRTLFVQEDAILTPVPASHPAAYLPQLLAGE